MNPFSSQGLLKQQDRQDSKNKKKSQALKLEFLSPDWNIKTVNYYGKQYGVCNTKKLKTVITIWLTNPHYEFYPEGLRAEQRCEIHIPAC